MSSPIYAEAGPKYNVLSFSAATSLPSTPLGFLLHVCCYDCMPFPVGFGYCQTSSSQPVICFLLPYPTSIIYWHRK